MKNTSLFTIFAFISVGLISCLKTNEVRPAASVTAKSDTSTTLATNTSLVGNWNIVTDTISFEADTMYHGTPSDHYIFTKYANLYIKSAFNNYTDTAVYSISGTDTLQWINSYWSEAGSVIRGTSSVGAYTITSVSLHSLILTQNGITPEGRRYEQITLKK